MFRSPQAYRTFLTVVMTYTLDLLGFSIAFPVFAPLLLNPDLHFFAEGVSIAERTTVLGLVFAVFGIAQFVGAPIAGALADHYGRFKVFIWTVGISIFAYLLIAFSIFQESLPWMFVGRILTGFCSGNFALAQSATADLTDVHHRSRAFGILNAFGSVGFIAGPWIGGKLANPEWYHGSGAFLFAAIAAFVNLLILFFFYVESWKRKHETHLFDTLKYLVKVFHHKTIGRILFASLLFSIGWGFFLVFSPTFLVQRFSLGSDQIGDIFAYQAVLWFFVSMFLNKELVGRCSVRSLIWIGLLFAIVGVALFVLPNGLWPYWFVIPIAITGGALAWVNLNAYLSAKATEEMQGRVLGAGGSMWSIGQIVAPLVAGPLAAWNMFSPLLCGSLFLLLALVYFLRYVRD